MTRDQATSALDDLVYEFHNEMVRRGINELVPGEWLEEFRSWLPTSQSFAASHQELVEWFEEMERAGR